MITKNELESAFGPSFGISSVIVTHSQVFLHNGAIFIRFNKNFFLVLVHDLDALEVENILDSLQNCHAFKDDDSRDRKLISVLTINFNIEFSLVFGFGFVVGKHLMNESQLLPVIIEELERILLLFEIFLMLVFQILLDLIDFFNFFS